MGDSHCTAAAAVVPRQLGLAPSRRGLVALRPLLGAGALQTIAIPTALAATRSTSERHGLLIYDGGTSQLLQRHWRQLELLVSTLATGALIRCLAPLLQHKARDPAVLQLTPGSGQLHCLLGGHSRDGERQTRRLAALLGGTALISSQSSAEERLPLDCFGQGWGWRRGEGDWSALMQRAARGEQLRWRQRGGVRHWQHAGGLAGLLKAHPGEDADMEIGPWLVAGACCWHPPSLWIGLGCERGTDPGLVREAVAGALGQAGLAVVAVAGLASISLKGDETALLELAALQQWPLRLFEAEQLRAMATPNPSQRVLDAVGSASVAEAAALCAAGRGGRLLLEKTVVRGDQGQGALTLAIALMEESWAPPRGSLQLVGSGPGALEQLTGAARAALAASTVWVGYGPYLDRLESLRQVGQWRADGQLGRERERCAEALNLARGGAQVALVSSGDSGIYGMAGLALELWQSLPGQERPALAFHPGISAMQMAAARLGGPLMLDFCSISLSDRLVPWATIQQRLRAAAAGDFVIALYNPRSRERHWQLGWARQLLLDQRPADTPVALCRQLGRAEETISLTTLAALTPEQVDMLTLVLIGNSSSRSDGRYLLTPRGYASTSLA